MTRSLVLDLQGMDKTAKEIIRRAFFHLYEPSDEAFAKYGIRLEYSDSEAEIRTV